MKITEKKNTDATITLEVEASVDEVTKAFEIATMAFEQTINPPSEEGKTTPSEQITFSTEEIDRIVEPQIAEYLAPFAVDKSNIMPDHMPTIQRGKRARRHAPYQFTLEVTPKPHFTLSSYDPVTISIPEFEIPEEEIERQITEMADSYAEFEQIQPRPARLGDSCLITINSTRNGAALPEISMENAIYTLGSQIVSADFDEKLVGMEAGDTRSFFIDYHPESDTMPEEDNETECIVTLIEVRKRAVPTIDDAWIAQNIPAAKDLETFKHLLREEFKKSYGDEFEEAKRREASAELATRFKGEIHDETLTAMRTTLINNLRIKLQKEGSSLEEYIEQNGGQHQFDVSMLMQAKETLAQGYALDSLYRHERMELTDEDILEACKTIDPEQPELIRKQMEYAGCGFTLRETAERLKAGKWLLSHATVVTEG